MYLFIDILVAGKYKIPIEYEIDFIKAYIGFNF